jgi:hypothetical protein
VGEKESEPFQFTFNGFLKVAFQGSRVTSDAGLVLVRELDERLGLEGGNVGELSEKWGGGMLVGRNPDLHGGAREVRPRRQEHSTHERSNRGRMLPILRSQIGNIGFARAPHAHALKCCR